MSPSDSGDPARIPGREGLLALIAKWREAIKESEREVAAGTYSQAGCDSQRGRRLVLAECADELEAALSAPPEPSADLVRELADFGEKLAAAQEDLPQDMARVLHDNLWELYDAIPVKAEAVPAPQQELQSAIDGALRELDIAASYDGAAEVSVGLRIHARACRLAAKNLRTAVSAALADDRRSAPRREVLAEFRQRIAAQPHYAPCPHNWAQPDRSQHCLCWMAPALDFLDAELSLGSAAGGHAPQPAPRREDGD